MPLPESSLSIACRAVHDAVGGGLNAAANAISLSMGAPSEVPDSNDHHRLNLFFYRIEPGGFEPGAHPNDPWRVRLFCLFTVFGLTDDFSAGENEMRILGHLIRLFRETPVLDAVAIGEEQVRMQAVFCPTTDEQINQIWSTQGDTSFRPSLLYEFALVPIMPTELRRPAPRVAATGNQAFTMADRFNPFSGVVEGPPVPVTTVDIRDPSWAPELCWIHEDDCARTLSLNEAEGVTSLDLWIAGDPAASVNLVWEIWDRAEGWRNTGTPVAAAPFSTTIDPNDIPTVPAFPHTVTHPVVIPAGQAGAQGMLYAVREVTRIDGSVVTVRSNPLLFNLFRVLP